MLRLATLLRQLMALESLCFGNLLLVITLPLPLCLRLRLACSLARSLCAVLCYLWCLLFFLPFLCLVRYPLPLPA